MTYSIPKFLTARTALDLAALVADEMKKGFDIHAPMFVSWDGVLAVWMAESQLMYQYVLVIAHDLDDYELQVSELAEQGYDLFWNLVMFRGEYLQWMGKLAKDAGGFAVLQMAAEVKA